MNDQLELIRTLVDQFSSKPPPARQDLGLLGRLFGARYASSNIAGLAVAVALLVLTALLVAGAFGVQYAFEREMVTGAFSLISLALGYLFGSAR